MKDKITIGSVTYAHRPEAVQGRCAGCAAEHDSRECAALLTAGALCATRDVIWVAEAPAGESDPTGRNQHEPGAKVDAGKPRPSLIIEGMARAIMAVSKVATFGAAKYTPGGWVLVPNGEERYADAGYRHVLKRAMGEEVDPDSEELHLAHEAWNALAKLDLYLRRKEAE